MNRLQVFHPTPRDNVEREAFIPETVKEAITQGKIRSVDHKPKRSRAGYARTLEDDHDDEKMVDTEYRKTARYRMWENGGPGVWAPDYREQYDLKDEEWRFDAIPELSTERIFQIRLTQRLTSVWPSSKSKRIN